LAKGCAIIYDAVYGSPPENQLISIERRREQIYFRFMAKTYRFYCPDQMFLLPPSLRDWLPEDHLAYFVSDIIDQLDFSKVEMVYERANRGQPPYNLQ
jgi:hypothetical protein